MHFFFAGRLQRMIQKDFLINVCGAAYLVYISETGISTSVTFEE
jgi:hypothetical protein